MKVFHKLSEWLDYACGMVCVVCVASMVALTGAQIVCRIWFVALSWSEELTRYLMVWATFLGAGCVYRRSGHISVTVIRALFPAPCRKAMEICCHLLCGAFFLAAVIYGIDYMGMQSRQLSAALRIPMSWVYLAIPTGCGIMALHVLDLLLKMLPGHRGKEGAA
ncbi:MAG: TRAP transporter small permease [Deltaproteobacteria bacterium]|jgi:TRAP-type C4-dicarboxylate transport system permease small subunit|nr:TRAP transporter small permease [Deltaproteobacteria bacterium]